MEDIEAFVNDEGDLVCSECNTCIRGYCLICDGCHPSIDGWNPIDTAPKDGTEILIGFENGCVEKVKWEYDTWTQSCDTELWVTSRGAKYWMPIPNLPEEKL